MTKKDFLLVARVISTSRFVMENTRACPKAERAGAVRAIRLVMSGLIGEFRAINPRFDEAKFIAACGF